MTAPVDAHRPAPSDSVPVGGPRPVSGVVLILLGLYQALNGLVSVRSDSFYAVVMTHAPGFDVGGHGWLHLGIGILVATSGFALLRGIERARAVAVTITGVSVLSSLLSTPPESMWPLLIIDLHLAAAMSLALVSPHGRDDR